MRRRLLALAVGLVVTAACASALAQKKSGRVITLGEIQIVGRVQRPIAAVDVARIRPTIMLAELKQPFINRIEAAIYKEPF